ncbi:hypothetical protein PG999_008578 [Apiospora kogelbergensis]|uniref:Nucleoside phosphorylase domain-containing protein n=1 Tax=Apiospora kogelbergensis TaxID=1337665 RepID=A0AAW0QIA7_9PEZI
MVQNNGDSSPPRMPPKLVPISEFTVAWVCALPIELAAATEIMDEIFMTHPSDPWEKNIYTFGRIGPHNVVVLCLPACQTGTNLAATVVEEMTSKFRSLRFGVLVGIGGGVPNLDREIDIRLGDVVVSQPDGAHGGVVQYDMGKTMPDGYNTHTGSLNAPPLVLLSALAKLRANDFGGRTSIRTHLQNLPSEFASPDPESDVLWLASSAHVGDSTCAKCHPDDQIRRVPRQTADPVLFYGNIASGNQVMRDGVARDRHSQALGGVLCFEMEAAGLMNSFPCLVFRGICDYADAHNNKLWQPYAAATAAATAKELLYTIPGNPPLPTIPDCKRISNSFNP